MPNAENNTPPQTVGAPGSALVGTWHLDGLSFDQFTGLVGEIMDEYGMELWKQAHEYWLGDVGGNAMRLSGSQTVNYVRACARDATDRSQDYLTEGDFHDCEPPYANQSRCNACGQFVPSGHLYCDDCRTN